MTKRIRRHPEFEIELSIRSDQFIRPPREAQRNWLLSRAIKEFSDDLVALDQLASRFVTGAEAVEIANRSESELTDNEIMEDWQIPVMKVMARIATRNRGDVLEIGFGRGISASFIQDADPASHTIVECNEHVIERFEDWRKLFPQRSIRLVRGLWQEIVDALGEYDAVFFHAYPLDYDEYASHVVQSSTFAEHFFSTAAQLLRPGGVFTYLTNEIDSLSRGHQRALLKHFSQFSVRLLGPLQVPADTRDSFWADRMAIVWAEI